MGNLLSECRGWTPVIDVLARRFDLVTAAVYGLVWRYCQMEDRVCRASLETLAGQLGLSRKTMERHLARLCEAGLLEDLTPDVRHRPHVYRDTGKVMIAGLIEARLDRPTTGRTTNETGPATASRRARGLTSEAGVGPKVAPGTSPGLTVPTEVGHPVALGGPHSQPSANGVRPDDVPGAPESPSRCDEPQPPGAPESRISRLSEESSEESSLQRGGEESASNGTNAGTLSPSPYPSRTDDQPSAEPLPVTDPKKELEEYIRMLCEITCQAWDVLLPFQQSDLERAARALRNHGFTLEELELFPEYYQKFDWRATKRGEIAPSLKVVLSEIGKVRVFAHRLKNGNRRYIEGEFAEFIEH